MISYFKGILDEIKDTSRIEIGDTNMVANFLIYSSTFGILRRWALKPFYSKEQVIDYLMDTQLKNILPPMND